MGGCFWGGRFISSKGYGLLGGGYGLLVRGTFINLMEYNQNPRESSWPAGAVVVAEDEATVVVEDEAIFVGEDEAIFVVEDEAILVVEDEAIVVVEDEAMLVVQDEAPLYTYIYI